MPGPYRASQGRLRVYPIESSYDRARAICLRCLGVFMTTTIQRSMTLVLRRQRWGRVVIIDPSGGERSLRCTLSRITSKSCWASLPGLKSVDVKQNNGFRLSLESDPHIEVNGNLRGDPKELRDWGIEAEIEFLEDKSAESFRGLLEKQIHNTDRYLRNQKRYRALLFTTRTLVLGACLLVLAGIAASGIYHFASLGYQAAAENQTLQLASDLMQSSEGREVVGKLLAGESPSAADFAALPPSLQQKVLDSNPEVLAVQLASFVPSDGSIEGLGDGARMEAIRGMSKEERIRAIRQLDRDQVEKGRKAFEQLPDEKKAALRSMITPEVRKELRRKLDD